MSSPGRAATASAPTEAGDSGAILVDAANRAIGLGFAGSEEVSLLQPIRRVLDALGVDLAI